MKTKGGKSVENKLFKIYISSTFAIHDLPHFILFLQSTLKDGSSIQFCGKEGRPLLL